MLKKVLKNFFKKFGYSIVDNQYLLSLEKNLIIEEISKYEENLLINCSKFTGTMTIPIWTLINSIKYVARNNIDGDFVEAGVWRGGNIIIYNELKKKFKLNNKIFAYDTFEGMPLPSKYDIKWDGTTAFNRYKLKSNDWCKCSLEDIKKYLINIKRSRRY